MFRATPFTYATLIVVSAALSTPLVFGVSIALSSDHTVAANSFTIFPHEFHWENFTRVFASDLPMGRFLVNSLIISVGSVIGQMVSSGLVGYAFARLRAPGIAFNVFLVRQFVSRLPSQLDEAAMVDGLGFFGIYRRIMIPMLWPVLIAIGIFTLTFNWGDFMGPLIYLTTSRRCRWPASRRRGIW